MLRVEGLEVETDMCHYVGVLQVRTQIHRDFARLCCSIYMIVTGRYLGCYCIKVACVAVARDEYLCGSLVLRHLFFNKSWYE